MIISLDSVLPDGTALREAMGEALVGLGARDERVVVLDGDVAGSTGAAAFESAYPDRFIQTGIAEQNMLGVAAGLATLGFAPFVTGFACFLVARALDSVRVLITQPSLDVKILGGYAGLATGKTGKTHQIFNEIAIMRSLPGMTVIAPADAHELRSVLTTVARTSGPAYVQITRDPSPQLFDDSYTFQLGRGVMLRDGSDATLISTGVQSTRTYQAAGVLARRGIDVRHLHLPCVVPIDEAAVVAAARETGRIITVEEQDVAGGLGGAVTEIVSEQHPVRVHRLGIQRCYGESGPNESLYEKYRLSAHAVADDVAALLQPSR